MITDTDTDWIVTISTGVYYTAIISSNTSPPTTSSSKNGLQTPGAIAYNLVARISSIESNVNQMNSAMNEMKNMLS